MPMKNIIKSAILTIFLSILLIGCTTHAPSIYQYGPDFNGNVKTIKQTNFTILKEFNPKKQPLNNGVTITTYNQNKDIVKYESFNNDESLSITKSWVYDEHGNKIEFHWKNVGQAESSLYKYKYDENNKVIAEYLYEVSSDTVKLSVKTDYIYDQNNRNIKGTHYYSDTIIYTDSYRQKYDDKNRLTEDVLFYDEAMKYLNFRHIYKYRGNTIEATKFDQSGQTDKTTYTYDDNDNLIEMHTNNSNDKLADYTGKFECDKYGNPTRFTKYNEAGEITYTSTDSYKYDEHDNWTEKISYTNNVPGSLIIREITYY